MIGAKRVTAPDGTEWRVGRRWLPDWPKLWRREKGDSSSAAEWANVGGFDDAFGLVLGIVVFVLVVFLLTTVVFPVLVLTLELLVVIVLVLGGIRGRLVFRKPWTIRARNGRGEQLLWHASGFRRSGRVRDEVASAIALGHTDIRPTEPITAVT